MDRQIKYLVNTLPRIVDTNKYPSFPYDLYRYFNLLENLEEQNELNFSVDRDPIQIDFSSLSYDQIRQTNFSRRSGTFQSRKMKKQMIIIDDEAQDVAHSLINRYLPIDKPMMTSFIIQNSHKIQLHIRDIPTMVWAIFLFLVLRKKPDKISILKKINKSLRPEAVEEKEDPEVELEPEPEVEPEVWGAEDDDGKFKIVIKTGFNKTSGAICMNKTIGEIQQILREENISEAEIDQCPKKKPLCELLQAHLKRHERHF